MMIIKISERYKVKVLYAIIQYFKAGIRLYKVTLRSEARFMLIAYEKR